MSRGMSRCIGAITLLYSTGVTMSQIGARRSAIGEESECTSDEDNRWEINEIIY